MKADARKQVQYLRSGLEQFLTEEDKHIANGTPRLRGAQYFALGALTKLSDSKIAASYYKLPTGFGKTVMFSYMAQAYLSQARTNDDKKKLVILVPRLNLINQTGDRLDSFAGFTASEFSGRAKDTEADIIISTYRSLDKLIETIGIENIGMVFADEAHHVTGDKISQTMTDLIKSVPTIGFTATPSYNANKSVANVMKTEIFAMTIADCVRSGMLSPVKNILYCSSIVYDLETVPATNQGEYDYNSITGQIDTETLTNEIADIYINGIDEDTGRRFIDCKAIINCPNIEMAKRQADAINQKAGCTIARAFSSDMKDFEAEKAKFIAGEYQVACQINTLTEGFDDTTVSLCINYPTRSAVRAEQAAGRAIRLNDSDPHKIAFVIDTIFRKHDGETSDTALQTARHAKQVLFKDIADGMVLIPENFNDGITHGKHRPHTRSKHETVKPYEIITSTETLLNLNRIDTDRAKEEKVPQKTSEWLTAKELTQYFPYAPDNISKKLVALAEEMKGKIEERQSGPNTALCLHINALDEFARLSELEKIPPRKTSEWLTAKELTQYFPYAPDNISKKLVALAEEMKGKIEERQSGPNTALCLHINALDEFARLSELEKIPPRKTSEWLTAKELTQYFPYASDNISKKLVALAEEMKGKIEKRQSGKQTCLCLHINALNEFAGLSKFKKRAPRKTSEWLTAQELMQYFSGGYRKILNELERLVADKKMPGKIEERQSGSNTALCLHINALDEFARLSELEKIAPRKTSEWLTAKELTQYFPYASDNISKKLVALAKPMKGKIEKRQSGSQTPLCLHISALDDFARLSGLKKRGVVTPEKFHAGTKVVEAMTKMAETKKQIKDNINPDNQYE